MADANKKAHIMTKIQKCAKALEANNMQTFIASSADEVKSIVKELLSDCDTVTMGGATSARECGIYELLKSGDYTFFDRGEPGLTPEQIDEMYRKAFTCDAYISGSNAITENGELYNVDGNSNRVAAMLYGPKKLIVIAGYNKIVKNIEQAVRRVKEQAAPINCVRLGVDNYCAKTGNCVSLDQTGTDMCSGCSSESRICCNYVVMSHQRKKDRVKVILVPEELGY